VQAIAGKNGIRRLDVAFYHFHHAAPQGYEKRPNRDA
jgi:hypothetical protein